MWCQQCTKEYSHSFILKKSFHAISSLTYFIKILWLIPLFWYRKLLPKITCVVYVINRCCLSKSLACVIRPILQNAVKCHWLPRLLQRLALGGFQHTESKLQYISEPVLHIKICNTTLMHPFHTTLEWFRIWWHQHPFYYLFLLLHGWAFEICLFYCCIGWCGTLSRFIILVVCW